MLIQEFRAHGAEIQRRFEAFRSWSRGFNKGECGRRCGVRRCISRAIWFQPASMGWELSHLCHPLPHLLVGGGPKRLAILHVRQQMIAKFQYHKRIHTDWGAANDVWRAFLRRINYWLYGEFKHARYHDRPARLYLGGDQLSDQGARRTEELAFALIFDVYGVDETALNRMPRGVSQWEGRIFRNQLMLMLLGALAGCIWKIDHTRKTGQDISWRELRMYAAAWSATDTREVAYGIFEASVFFPQIVGLPVRWTAAIREAYQK